MAGGCLVGSWINCIFGCLEKEKKVIRTQIKASASESNELLSHADGEMGLDDPLVNWTLKYNLKPTTDSIHQCVSMAVGNLWNSSPYKTLLNAVKGHIANNDEVEKALRDNPSLTEDEIGSLIYYTSDIRKFNGKVEDCIFTLINRDLRSRDPNHLNKWLPFLYYIHEAKKHLPLYKGRVYRGIKEPITKISTKYMPGKNVVWISFTSTTKDDSTEVIKSFTKDDGTGTWMILDITDGIEIPFSLFPTENEVLLYPNTIVHVDSILDAGMKTILKVPTDLVVIRFTQQ